MGRWSRTTPSRTTPTEYRYDTLGRLKEVEDIAGTAEYVYDGNGNLATVLNPNETETNYYYDSMDRLLGTETLNASEIIYSVTYSLRADGKRSDIEEHIWDGDNERVRYGGYGYDNHGRLTYEGWGCGDDFEELNYVYDDAGNRTRMWGTDENGESVDTTYTTNSLDQLRTETENGNTTYYAYDANGNLCAKGTGIADATTSYKYNLQGLLAQVIEPGETAPSVEYRYDARGNRLMEKEPNPFGVPTTTYFMVDTNNPTGYSQTLAELDAMGTVVRSYTYGHDLLSTRTPATPTNPATCHYYHYDGLGSVRALTDHSGEMQNRYGYRAFGETLSSLTSTSIEQAYQFTGERFDPLTGYYHLRARQYMPGIGRFTSFDPNRDIQNRFHKYSYCNSQPTNWIDPSGAMGSLGDSLPTLAAMGTLVSTFVSTTLGKAVLVGGMFVGSAFTATLVARYRWRRSVLGSQKEAVLKAAREYNIDPYLLAATVYQQTGYPGYMAIGDNRLCPYPEYNADVHLGNSGRTKTSIGPTQTTLQDAGFHLGMDPNDVNQRSAIMETMLGVDTSINLLAKRYRWMIDQMAIRKDDLRECWLHISDLPPPEEVMLGDYRTLPLMQAARAAGTLSYYHDQISSQALLDGDPDTVKNFLDPLTVSGFEELSDCLTFPSYAAYYYKKFRESGIYD